MGRDTGSITVRRPEFSLADLPINSLPDVTPVQVLVITKAGRYSPYDVERLVSFPVETVMNGLPDVAEVRSISQFGLSAVTVEFAEGTDIYFARQLVAQRVQSVASELPDGVDAPQLGPISTALGEIVQYTVEGEGRSRRVVQVNTVETPLGWLRNRKDTDGRPLLTEAEYEAGERLREDFTNASNTTLDTEKGQVSSASKCSWEMA